MLTSPRRAGKDHDVIHASEPRSDDFKAVASNEDNLVFNSVDLCVVLCALHGLGIFLNGEDLRPSSRSGKCNSISSDTCKSIDNNRFLLRSCF